MAAWARNPLFRWWHRPLPFYKDRMEALRITLAAGCFISFFCVVFQPFGMFPFDDGALDYLRAVGFGGVALLIVGFNTLLLPLLIGRWLRTRHWTVGKEVHWGNWNIFSTGVGNYVYAVLVYDVPPGWEAFGYMQLYTFGIGIFPAMGIMTLKHIQLYRLARAIPEQGLVFANRADPNALIRLAGENAGSELNLLRDQLLYLEARGQYLHVHFLEDGGTGHALLRMRISAAEAALSGHEVLQRCHRKYIVNFNHVVEVIGQPSGFLLALEGVTPRIPVTPKYSEVVRRYFEYVA